MPKLRNSSPLTCRRSSTPESARTYCSSATDSNSASAPIRSAPSVPSPHPMHGRRYNINMSPIFRLLPLAALFLSLIQQGNAQRTFPVPPLPKEVTITAIPGVIDAGAKWTIAWQGSENADGIVGTKDGGLLFAQEQSNHVMKLDKKGKVSVYLSAHGPGAVAIGPPMDRVLVVERTCTDPGDQPDLCKEPTGIAALTPTRI